MAVKRKSATDPSESRPHAQQSDNIVVATPSSSTTIPVAFVKRRRTLPPPRSSISRSVKIHKQEDKSNRDRKIEQKKERGRAIGKLPGPKQQKISQGAATTTEEPPKCNDSKQEAADQPAHMTKQHDHTVLQNVQDIDHFISAAQEYNAIGADQRVLEVHLDAGINDEYADLRLAIALNILHARTDGTNSHHLQKLKLVLEGKWLYTRYSYSLASAALSPVNDSPLKKFAYGGLTKLQEAQVHQHESRKDMIKRLQEHPLSKQQKAKLSFKVNSTEKIVANALLGIRGLQQVEITGSGALEGTFAQVMQTTLVQPPGTEIAEPTGDNVANSTLQLYKYGQGAIDSTTYQRERHSARSKSSVGSKGNDEELGMDDMVRIRKLEQEEGDSEMQRINYLDEAVYPLTDWQNTVELGWEM
ncbi:hypothetical protein ACEQ8H_001139 [Pleosporales sp. CAS-2024a]